MATDMARLTAFGSATAFEAAGARGMVAPTIRALWPGARVAGPARCVRGAAGDNLALHRALAVARPGEVLVASVDGDVLHGAWGEVMTEAALARGVAGLVLDGAVRDTAAIARLGFPVFAAGVAVGSCAKRALGTVGEPVELGGVGVAPGDVVVADDDGVVVIEAGRLRATLAAAEARSERERRLIEALRDGKTTLELLGLDVP